MIDMVRAMRTIHTAMMMVMMIIMMMIMTMISVISIKTIITMKAHTPAYIRAVMHAAAIGHRHRIIIRTIPWIIIITCTIYYYSTVYITTHVRRRVAHVYNL